MWLGSLPAVVLKMLKLKEFKIFSIFRRKLLLQCVDMVPFFTCLDFMSYIYYKYTTAIYTFSYLWRCVMINTCVSKSPISLGLSLNFVLISFTLIYKI